MSEIVTAPPKRRVRTERLEVIVDPEAEKLDLVTERIRLQKDMFVKELKSRLGLIMMTCEATGISHDTVKNWARTDQKFLEQISGVQEYTLDAVEQRFLKKIIDEGDTTAMIFYLKTKGKNRGFSTRLELTGANGGPLESEQTIKMAEIQKELPDDVLNAIIASTTANQVQPVAKPVQALPAVTQAAVDAGIGYTIEDEEEEEELELP